ncbi:hypothetical protein FSP39_008944 [Pinctada imbricata]|uniref:Reverse transcriptase domain-containing protein n=1 Tax=Pinctada imbricata TaxID=66713 RepID=A0AA88Y3Q4_PINIB|nr:hypothetical protein FSP39_008944 [Pinctada imbricata]
MILESKEIPQQFQCGVIHPIHKRGKDASLCTNYRGITVSSTIGKVFEHVILRKIEEKLPSEQSSLQFGFTKGMSPLMAALVLSETIVEGIENNVPVYLAYLDTQKAFDVVDHNSMKCKLFHQDVNHHIWKTVDKLYSTLSSKVIWKGELSDSFAICQGVRQGGILSTGLYKVYINDLLLSLEKSRIGATIESTYVGCPTVADDLSLASNYEIDTQHMLDISYKYANRERYIIHPEKSVLMRRFIPKGYQETMSDWKLGDTEISISTNATHVGILRSSEDELGKSVDERISCARITLYSMTYTGLHGSNGLTPAVCSKIYQTYVLPRLLYGMEITVPLRKHIEKLESFHISTLRIIQSLPKRTSRSICYLLLGIRPIEAEIHIRQLTFFGSIVRSGNSTLLNLTRRQLALKTCKSRSWFVHVEGLVERYGLPSLDTILDNTPTKTEWKKIVYNDIEKYWRAELVRDCMDKSTLSSCNLDSLQFGTLHPLWKYQNSCIMDVKRGTVKARLLTGTYIVQSKLARFNQNEVDPTCQFCRRNIETYAHMLLKCGALHSYRKPHIEQLRSLLMGWSGSDLWNNFSLDIKLQCVLDVSVHVNGGLIPNNQDFLHKCEQVTKKLCYSVHCGRLYLQNMLNGRTRRVVDNAVSC